MLKFPGIYNGKIDYQISILLARVQPITTQNLDHHHHELRIRYMLLSRCGCFRQCEYIKLYN